MPQIAQMRPTSRQRMQRVADELAAEGLVESSLNARFLVIASTMGVALSEADIRKTTEIVRQLSDDVKARRADKGTGGL